MKKPNKNGYRYFKTDADVQGYVESELLDTLRDDLGKMENEERQHYTHSDRKEMESRIADLETYFAKPSQAEELVQRLVEKWREPMMNDEEINGGDAVEWLSEFWADAEFYLRTKNQ